MNKFDALNDDQKLLYRQLWYIANDGVIPSFEYLKEVFDALTESAKDHSERFD